MVIFIVPIQVVLSAQVKILFLRDPQKLHCIQSNSFVEGLLRAPRPFLTRQTPARSTENKRDTIYVTALTIRCAEGLNRIE